MTQKLKSIVLIILILSISLIFFQGKIKKAFSQTSPPEISIWNVKSVTLRLFYDAGSVGGYVIFLNKGAEQCATKGYARLYYSHNGKKTLKKQFEFDSSDFKYLTLRSGDIVYALPIKDFVFRPAGEGTIFYFEIYTDGYEQVAEDKVYRFSD